jgi:hypothetical protein
MCPADHRRAFVFSSHPLVAIGNKGVMLRRNSDEKPSNSKDLMLLKYH